MNEQAEPITILIAEDDRLACRELNELFTASGFSVRLHKTGSSAVEDFRANRPDVVLLDVMMPRGDGFEACRKIRQMDDCVPIIFHTALDVDADKVLALELGADDYVLKSDPRNELLARVRRALDRYQAFFRMREEMRRTHGVLTIGSVTIDLVTSRLSGGGARDEIELTRTETDLLRLLASDRGRSFTCYEIIDALRGEGYICDDNTVYVHIHHLRRKLGRDSSYLRNDRGRGYSLAPQRGEAAP